MATGRGGHGRRARPGRLKGGHASNLSALSAQTVWTFMPGTTSSDWGSGVQPELVIFPGADRPAVLRSGRASPPVVGARTVVRRS